ncbi:hypothetical protein ACFJIV_33615 [Mucilaginibacter sp. UC70_90]
MSRIGRIDPYSRIIGIVQYRFRDNYRFYLGAVLPGMVSPLLLRIWLWPQAVLPMATANNIYVNLLNLFIDHY